jgi:hypothetical protein
MEKCEFQFLYSVAGRSRYLWNGSQSCGVGDVADQMRVGSDSSCLPMLASP